MLSDLAKKWISNFAERFAGTYEEGPRAPARLRDQVLAFANHEPKATRERWANFAADLAAESYEAGYRRGFEWCERDPDAAMGRPPFTPEQLASRVDPDWAFSPAVELFEPEAIPTDEPNPRLIQEQVAMANAIAASRRR